MIRYPKLFIAFASCYLACMIAISFALIELVGMDGKSLVEVLVFIGAIKFVFYVWTYDFAIMINRRKRSARKY